MEKFRTNIVKRFSNGIEYFTLLLPDGRCVASGSFEHCLNERDRWEPVLSIKPVQLSLDFV